MESRTLKVLTDVDIAKVANAYHAWRETGGRYGDELGFSKSVTTKEIAAQDYVLLPGRYVGSAEIEADGERFEEKMKRLATMLRHQQEEGTRLDDIISANLKGLGHGS